MAQAHQHIRPITHWPLLCALVVMCLGQPAAAQYPYTLTDLGKLGGPKGSTWPEAVNNAGQVVGKSSVVGGTHAFLWQTSSGMVDLGDLPGGDEASGALDINQLGQIAGYATNEAGPQAVIWDNGSIIPLGSGSGTGRATGINNRGAVVGEADDVGGSGAFFWSAGSGLVFIPAPVPATSSSAYAINRFGRVAATGFAGSVIEPFRWTLASGVTPLSDLPTGDTVAYGFAINDDGYIAGRGNVTAGDRAVVWKQDGTAIDLGTVPDGFNSYAFGINNLGQTVGSVTNTDGHLAAIWQHPGATPVDLNTLIDPDSGWGLIEARDINDVGQIVGIGATPAGTLGGYLLSPVPTVTAVWPNDDSSNILLVFGSGFTPHTQVRFDGVPAPGTEWVSGTLLATLKPFGVTTADIEVVTPWGSAVHAGWGQIGADLSITGVWPSQAVEGTVAFLFGSGFEPHNTHITLDGAPLGAVQFVSEDLVLFLVPSGASSGLISVTTSQGTVQSATPFFVL